MKTYKVLTTCTVGTKYYEKDRVIELDDDVVVSKHLELVSDDSAKVAKPVDESSTLSGMQKKQVELTKPKTGFAAQAEPEKKFKPEFGNKKKAKKK